MLKAGSNLLLHTRVESYPYIGITWLVTSCFSSKSLIKCHQRHESGSKLRQNSSTHKLVDDDGNVVLVVCNATDSNFYNCSIINEIAENSTTCQVTSVLIVFISCSGGCVQPGPTHALLR